jgi:hypothetical protein
MENLAATVEDHFPLELPAEGDAGAPAGSAEREADLALTRDYAVGAVLRIARAANVQDVSDAALDLHDAAEAFWGRQRRSTLRKTFSLVLTTRLLSDNYISRS